MDLYGSLSVSSPLKRDADLAGLKPEDTEPENGHWKKRDVLPNGKKTKGRVKIKMEFIDNKLRRYTTFSKRKTGIMKKAYELSTLTGTEVMLLVASETGHVYTFATKKLQPMITSEAGKALIQTCLNSPEDGDNEGREEDQRMSAAGFEETDLSYAVMEDREDLDRGTGEQDREDEDEADDPLEAESEDESPDPRDVPTNLSMHPQPRGVGRTAPPSSRGANAAAAYQTVLFNPSFTRPTLIAPAPSPSESKPCILAPSLPPEILAQLGYTNFFAQASSNPPRWSGALASPVVFLSPRKHPGPPKVSHLQPRDPGSGYDRAAPHSLSPENLSLQKDNR